jgi:hypothetical protein
MVKATFADCPIQKNPINMASMSYKVGKFKVYFLRFLTDNPNREVHIYNEVMNYWSNDSSDISLTEIKSAITDLCDKHFITSKNNAHNSIGLHDTSEQEQKDKAICTILDAGKKYLQKADLNRKIKIAIRAAVILALLYLLWHFAKLVYLLR